MTFFKHGIRWSIVFLSILFLAGCSQTKTDENNRTDDNTAIYSGTLDGAATEFTIVHQGDEMQTVTLLATFSFTDLGLAEDETLSDEQKEQLETALAGTFEEYADTTGVTLENQFTDTAFEVEIQIDMSTVDNQSFAALTGTTLPDNLSPSQLSYQDFVSTLSANGFTEVTS